MEITCSIVRAWDRSGAASFHLRQLTFEQFIPQQEKAVSVTIGQPANQEHWDDILSFYSLACYRHIEKELHNVRNKTWMLLKLFLYLSKLLIYYFYGSLNQEKVTSQDHEKYRWIWVSSTQPLLTSSTFQTDWKQKQIVRVRTELRHHEIQLMASFPPP